MDSGSRNRFGKVLTGLGLALLLATTVHGQVGTAFTYQGQLQNNGTPQNGPCDLRFKLFDSASGGNQFGSTQTLTGVNVANGLFTVAIDFGGSGFSGSASWLETAVTCPSGGSFTTLSPRQAMTPAPNAVFAENAATNSDGTTIVGNGTPISKLSVAVPLNLQQTSSIATFYAANFGSAQGVAGFSASYYGVQGKSTSSYGVFGESQALAGVYGHALAASPGVSGLSDGGGAGIYGTSNLGAPGVWGTSDGYGVYGSSNTSFGVYGIGSSSNGVEGLSTNGFGVHGTSATIDGVRGESSTVHAGTSGINNTQGDGLYGFSLGDPNAYDSGTGVHAAGTATCAANACSNGSWGLQVDGPGLFTSFAIVDKDLDVYGNKNFVTPHPTDPSKQIAYTALEGPESGTYFRGTAHLLGGYAEIDVPESFRLVSSENGLTAIATPVGAPAVIACMSKSLEKIVFHGSSDVDFDYVVNGVRAGFEDHATIQPNFMFVPRRASDHRLAQLPAEAVRRLKANHILNDDGSVNEETAQRMGWAKRADWNQPDPHDAERNR